MEQRSVDEKAEFDLVNASMAMRDVMNKVTEVAVDPNHADTLEKNLSFMDNVNLIFIGVKMVKVAICERTDQSYVKSIDKCITILNKALGEYTLIQAISTLNNLKGAETMFGYFNAKAAEDLCKKAADLKTRAVPSASRPKISP